MRKRRSKLCAYMLLDAITPSSYRNYSIMERDKAARFSEIETEGPGDSESPIKSILKFLWTYHHWLVRKTQISKKWECIARGMAILYRIKKSLFKSVQKWLNASMRTRKTVMWPKYSEKCKFRKNKKFSSRHGRYLSIKKKFVQIGP